MIRMGGFTAYCHDRKMGGAPSFVALWAVFFRGAPHKCGLFQPFCSIFLQIVSDDPGARRCCQKCIWMYQ
jgi:hypothetical protein